MKKNNKRICICCGKEYEFCYNCGDNRKKYELAWKNNYDVESCRDVFNTITDYRMGILTPEEASEKLKTIDMVNRATYTFGIAKYVDELLGDNKHNATKAENKVTEPEVRKETEAKEDVKVEESADVVKKQQAVVVDNNTKTKKHDIFKKENFNKYDSKKHEY